MPSYRRERIDEKKSNRKIKKTLAQHTDRIADLTEKLIHATD